MPMRPWLPRATPESAAKTTKVFFAEGEASSVSSTTIGVPGACVATRCTSTGSSKLAVRTRPDPKVRPAQATMPAASSMSP